MKAKIQTGNRIQIKNIPRVSDSWRGIEIWKGGELIKSAGSSGKITSQDGEMAQIELPSGEVRYISKECYATIGVVSNADHAMFVLEKQDENEKWDGDLKFLENQWIGWPSTRRREKDTVPIGLKAPKTPWELPH